MAPGIAGASHHKRSHIGLERAHSVEGGPGILHAKNVVDLEMGGGAVDEARFVDTVLRVIGHGLGRNLEQGGFIHVVPEPGNALG